MPITAVNSECCSAIGTFMRLKALAAAPVGQAPENKNCRREVLDIPDLEFCAGEASITPGHKSETLEVPGTRAISAFFVGGGRGFESAKEACGGVQPKFVFWLEAIGRTKLKGKSSLHYFVVTRCVGFIHEILFSSRLKAAAEGRAPENENCRREVPEIKDLEFGAREASSTPVHRSETLEVAARRAISAFFVLGGGASQKSHSEDLLSVVRGENFKASLLGGDVGVVTLIRRTSAPIGYHAAMTAATRIGPKTIIGTFVSS